MQTARRVRGKSNWNDSGWHRLLVDLQELDAEVRRVRSLKPVNRAKSWVKLIMRLCERFGLLVYRRLASVQWHLALLLAGQTLSTFALGLFMFRNGQTPVVETAAGKIRDATPS